MQHALVTIEQSAPASVIKTPEVLTAGHINYAADLFKAYVMDADTESTQVKLILSLAIVVGLTCAEFKAQCKAAQTLADDTDKSLGFTPAADAKGSDKYGPKRRLLNQRLSEAKQIFGAAKVNPASLQEKGYWATLDAARTLLATENIKWDGEPIPDDATSAQRKETKGVTKAMAAAMIQHPQQAGEDMAEYMARLIPIAREMAFEDEVNNLVQSFVKTHGHGDLALTVCLRILTDHATPDQMDDYVQHFGEESMIRRLEESNS